MQSRFANRYLGSGIVLASGAGSWGFESLLAYKANFNIFNVKASGGSARTHHSASDEKDSDSLSIPAALMGSFAILPFSDANTSSPRLVIAIFPFSHTVVIASQAGPIFVHSFSDVLTF